MSQRHLGALATKIGETLRPVAGIIPADARAIDRRSGGPDEPSRRLAAAGKAIIAAMAVLDILHHPDPRLRNVAVPVEAVDDEVRQLADDLLETMYSARGIGLAAVQVGIARRVIVADVSRERNAPLALVNPRVAAAHGEEAEFEEGCLSVPGVYETVSRPERVRIEAWDRDGNAVSMEAEGTLAACLQHEIDHLDGRLFVDYLSRLKQQRIRKRALKQQREALA